MAINRNIQYINKDFNDYRSQLINFSQTYFPNTYTDFSNSSPGIMFIEQISYVGDVLSFYLDNQIQENYLQYASQTNNLYELAYMYGYKPKVTGLATTDVDFFQLLPAKTVDGVSVPDYDYALLIDENKTISSIDGAEFITEDSIDFTVSNSLDPTTVTVAQISSGNPTYFLLKKTKKAISSTITTTTFEFGEFQEFPTVEINTNNLAQILDIVDSDGNKWYEVDYLAQELVYVKTKNTNINDPNNYQNEGDVPYILETLKSERRFTTRFINNSTLQIQFGSGNPQDTTEKIIPNPDNVGLGLPFEQNKLTAAYSPTNFIFTNTYGIAPTNTTLTVRYLTGGGTNANVDADSLTIIDSTGIAFQKQNLVDATAQYIFDSVSVNNPNAATGGKDGDTIEEIRQNSISNFNSQQRAVTQEDYLVRALSMPSSYGIVSKALAQKPKANEGKATLDLYTLSLDINSNLTLSSSTLKQNLKTYLNQYRVIGDSINIKDAFIINIGCEFDIITVPNVNNNIILNNCLVELQKYFSLDNWQINQPIILTNIELLLDSIEGVQTVKNLKIINKVGEQLGYSKYAYDIDGATQNKIIYPSLDPMIFEVKFPNEDIKGRVVNL